ncbi:hypothetical protein E3N88_20073 [Mikania micrantha]|uniref:Uncharacterized protein n=1 Tax=Mikania micrantha TaxID=192012 RepID=A0A5N6NHP2_9ASTR|nr:hypothetical protein E3N88_20073 [Mikania micrantha]
MMEMEMEMKTADGELKVLTFIGTKTASSTSTPADPHSATAAQPHRRECVTRERPMKTTGSRGRTAGVRGDRWVRLKTTGSRGHCGCRWVREW